MATLDYWAETSHSRFQSPPLRPTLDEMIDKHARQITILSRAQDEPLYGLGCQGSAVSLSRIVLAFLTRLLESMADCDSSKRANARRDRVPAKRVRTETALGLRVRFNLRFHLPAGDRRMHHTPI